MAGVGQRPSEVRPVRNNDAIRRKKSQPWKVKKNSSISQVWVLMREKKLRCGAAAALTWFRWPTVVIYCSSLSSRPERFVSPEAALKAV